MSLVDELNNAQAQLNLINFEVSTGAWDGPNIVSPVVLSNCYQVETTTGMSQVNAAASLYFPAPFSIPINAPVQVFAGYNGTGKVIFKGEVSGRGWQLAPGQFILPCADRLARTRMAWAGAERVYAVMDDADIIRNILEAYGLPSSIMDIESSGMTLGIVQEIVLSAGQTGWSIIEEIDRLTSHRTYTDSTGVIRRRNIFNGIAEGTSWAFVETVNLANVTRTQSPLWPNQQTVKGLTYEGLEIIGTATAVNPNIPSPPGLLAASDLQSDLIETEEQAEASAQAALNYARTQSEKFTISAPGNPIPEILDMLHVVWPSIGFEGDTIATDVQHSVSANTWMTTINTMGILNADDATSGFDPVAIATATVDQEAVKVSGVMSARYFVALDGSASYDTDGQIVSYVWSVPGGTPSSGSGAQFATVVTDPTGLTASLTVTDEQGLTGTTTISLDPADVPAKTRQLAVAAAGAGLAFLSDGSTTPLLFARSGQECLSVPPIFSGLPLAGWDDGAVTRVNADLTTLDTLYTFPNAVQALFINEANAAHILVGAGPELWRSTDDGVTWNLLYTFDDDITDLQSSPTALNDIRVTAGPSLWQAGDAVSFAALVTGESGSTAMMLGSAGWGNAVVFKDAPAPGYTVKFESGSATVDWSGVSSPPTSLHSITPNLVARGYVVGDSTGRLFTLTPGGSGYVAALIATLGSGNMAGDLQRDGSMDAIVYAAAHGGSGSAAYKLINRTTAYELYGGDILQLGYGDLTSLTGVYELLWPTWGGSAPGIWHYEQGAWSRIPFPLSDRAYYCYGIAANRVGNQVLTVWTTDPAPRTFGDNDWWYHDVSGTNKVVMRGASYSPLWHLNLDTGVWTEVALPSPHPGPYTYTPSNGPILLHVPSWAYDSDTAWVITRSGDAISGGTSLNSWWRGNGTSAGPVISDLSGVVDEYTGAAILAPGGDLVLYEYIPGNQLRVAAPGVSSAVDVGSTTAAAPGGDGRVDLIGDGPGVVWAMNTGDIYATPDYTDTTPTLALSSIGHAVAWATHGVYVGRRGGVYKITDILGTPAGSTPVSDTVAMIRSDRQTRQTVAALGNAPGGGVVATLDGTTWDTIARPSAAASGELSLYAIEPLRR